MMKIVAVTFSASVHEMTREVVDMKLVATDSVYTSGR